MGGLSPKKILIINNLAGQIWHALTLQDLT